MATAAIALVHAGAGFADDGLGLPTVAVNASVPTPAGPVAVNVGTGSSGAGVSVQTPAVSAQASVNASNPSGPAVKADATVPPTGSNASLSVSPSGASATASTTTPGGPASASVSTDHGSPPPVSTGTGLPPPSTDVHTSIGAGNLPTPSTESPSPARGSEPGSRVEVPSGGSFEPPASGSAQVDPATSFVPKSPSATGARSITTPGNHRATALVRASTGGVGGPPASPPALISSLVTHSGHGQAGGPRGDARPTAPSAPPRHRAPGGAVAAAPAGPASSGLIFVALAMGFLWTVMEVSRRRLLLPDLRRPPLILHLLERPG